MMKDTAVKVDDSKRFQVKASPLGEILGSFATRVDADKALVELRVQYAGAVVVDTGVRPASISPNAQANAQAVEAGKTAAEKQADSDAVLQTAIPSAPRLPRQETMQASSGRRHSSRPSR